jgi:dTDP-glucose pyrophosphorylase
MKSDIKELIIELDAGVNFLDALLQMDSTGRKLLIVTEKGKFKSLLSIGDIQRAIIKGIDLKSSISTALRDSINISRPEDSTDDIKKMMLELRCEFMPIVDQQNELVDVYFWEDLIDSKKSSSKKLDLPVVIMAGGKGTRLKPITNIIPKPLVPIGNKAIMEHIIDNFVHTGCNRFYCSVNYKSKMIENYFDEIERDYNIEYFQEEFPMGTAGSLSLLKDKLQTSFFVSNCDILIDQDYSEIYDFHKKHAYELTIVATLKNYKIPYGILDVSENGRLEAVKEKPDLTFFVNTGMYILEPELLKEIPDDKYFDITDLFQLIKNRDGKIGVFPISEGAWMDIGNWEEYNKTQDVFKKRYK